MKVFKKIEGKENLSLIQVKEYFNNATPEHRDTIFAAREKWFDETKSLEERRDAVSEKLHRLSAMKKIYVTRIPQTVPRDVIGKMNSITTVLKSFALEEEKALCFTNEFAVAVVGETALQINDETFLTAGDKRFKDWTLYQVVDIENPF